MNSTSKLLLSVLGAAAAGAIIGMLLAPEKGSELRKRISETAGDWTSQLNQLVASGKAQLENLKETASNAAGEAENLANDKVRERV